MSQLQEHTTFIQDDQPNPVPSEKNQTLATFLQSSGINLQIVKIERVEIGSQTGWVITYRN